MENKLTKPKILEISNKIIQKANSLYGTHLKLTDVNIRDNLGKNRKGFQIIGTAQVKAGKYYLNLSSDAIESSPDHVVLDTIPHEIAHMVCFDLDTQGKYTDTIRHGAQWKKIAKSLGSDGMAASEISLPKRGVKQFAYRTTNGNIQYVNKKIHDNIQKKFLVYKTKSGSRITAASFIQEIN